MNEIKSQEIIRYILKLETRTRIVELIINKLLDLNQINLHQHEIKEIEDKVLKEMQEKYPNISFHVYYEGDEPDQTKN